MKQTRPALMANIAQAMTSVFDIARGTMILALKAIRGVGSGFSLGKRHIFEQACLMHPSKSLPGIDPSFSSGFIG